MRIPRNFWLLWAIPNIYHIINYARKIKIKANSFRKGTDFVPAIYFCVHTTTKLQQFEIFMISISLVWQSGYGLMESLTGPNSLKLSQALTGKDSLPSSLSWLLLGFNSVCYWTEASVPHELLAKGLLWLSAIQVFPSAS